MRAHTHTHTHVHKNKQTHAHTYIYIYINQILLSQNKSRPYEETKNLETFVRSRYIIRKKYIDINLCGGIHLKTLNSFSVWTNKKEKNIFKQEYCIKLVGYFSIKQPIKQPTINSF